MYNKHKTFWILYLIYWLTGRCIMVDFISSGGTCRVKVLTTSQFSTFIDNFFSRYGNRNFFTKVSIFLWKDRYSWVNIQKWEHVPTCSCFGRIHTSITFLLFVPIHPRRSYSSHSMYSITNIVQFKVAFFLWHLFRLFIKSLCLHNYVLLFYVNVKKS